VEDDFLRLKAQLAAVLVVAMAAAPFLTGIAKARAVHYERVQVDGIDIFCREAGSPHAPTLLLLHGFPSSSFMFRDLIPPPILPTLTRSV
jgi:hypothetical protein